MLDGRSKFLGLHFCRVPFGKVKVVVWDEDAGIADRVVLGRFRDPRNTSQTATFTIQDSVGNDQNADVGGSFATDGLSTAAFLVGARAAPRWLP
jgi:hypothetical protein